jgi:hypothetical protein
MGQGAALGLTIFAYRWWVDGEINRAFQKEARLMKERGKKVLALVPLNQTAIYSHGRTARPARSGPVSPPFQGWEINNTVFETQFERLVCALRADGKGREPPPSRL